MVSAAKACITLCWRDPKPPSIALWLNRVRDIGAMEDLVLSAQDRKEQYTRTWADWDQFVYSEEGRRLLRKSVWGMRCPAPRCFYFGRPPPLGIEDDSPPLLFYLFFILNLFFYLILI